MAVKTLFEQRAVTLVELLMALVICGMVVAGSYRFFIAQSKSYAMQDRVIEAQQNIRQAMEILLRDLRMAGYDDDGLGSTVIISEPISIPLRDDAITLSYEHYDATRSEYQKHTVSYWRETPSKLIRQLSINDVVASSEVLLEDLMALRFTYGVDVNWDGEMDAWVRAEEVGTSRIMAVHVALSVSPGQKSQDLARLSPRGLSSSVTLKNICSKR